ncbi:MAG: hypothetical protein OEW18_07795 [Candidatus Aminicenantes bacterium]|nr:hypothetical protein [Candidatus Aminicenantes bacterium]
MNILRFAPRFSDADGVVSKFCAKSLRVPAAAELVYLPFVLFKYSIRTSGYTGKRKTAPGLFLVDLVQATPMNIRAGTVFLTEGNMTGSLTSLISVSSSVDGDDEGAIRVGTQEIAATQVLPALLDREEAVSRGKRVLRYDLMRLAGGLRYRNWEMVIHPEMAVVHYPFWIIYYRNRRGEMQLGVLDGLNGRREGGEIAASIRKGLVEKKNEC